MKFHIRLSAFLALVLVAVAPSQAQQEETVDVAAKIESLLGMKAIAVADSPVPGLIQVMTDRGLFYTSADGKYLVHGRVYDMDDGMRNVTEEAMYSVRKEGVEAFLPHMIEFKAANEKHVVSIFTDITCGYCRKLHSEIASYNDLGITVRYLAFPRGGIGSRSFDDLVSIWCAKDQQTAMTNAKAGGEVVAATCETKVEEQYMFGQQVGVTGTPAIVLEDGSMIPGYQPAERLATALGTSS